MAFNKDLKDGKNIENEILALLQTRHPTAHIESGQDIREYYDIIIPGATQKKDIKIEIKGDFYKSENMAFECLGRNSKPTGVIKTASDYWVQFRNEKYYVWNTRLLRRYLLNVGGLIRNCGDDKASAAWIIPEEKILKECPPKAVIERNSVKLCEVII